jgi:uncharacterized Tic20 family protein
LRKAAGILMVVLGLTIMCRYVDVLGKNDVYLALSFSLFVIISAVFVITGGLFCLKRKYWVLCFISSLFFNYFVLVICAFEIFPYVLNWFLAPAGIVPLIFTCLRKREWQEIGGK